MSRHGFSLLLLLTLSLPLYGQALPGAAGDRTEAILDQERPLVIMHLDSLGNTLSIKSYAYPPGSPHPSQVTVYRSPEDWERRSYRYAGDQLASMAIYGPAGLKDSLSWKDLSVSARAKWSSLPKAPDPAEEWRMAGEAGRLCSQDPLLSPDPIDGQAFLFAADGRFLSRVRSGYEGGALLLWMGEGLTPFSAPFADPDYDAAHIGPESRATLVRQEYIANAMELCGVENLPRKGLFPGCRFLLKNSTYGGVLDFAVRPEYGISPDTFYLTHTEKEGPLAHNHFNFGNFLWGASARELRVPLWVTRLGAHINNFFFSPDSRFHLDSADDQLSISAGYHCRQVLQF